MQMRSRLATFAFALSFLPATAAAADLFVGPAGSGAAYAEITDALAAASPGDTVHVAAGTYDAFTVDFPVRVLGAGSGAVFIHPSAAALGTAVRNVPAGGDVLLSGLTFLETDGGSKPFVLVEDTDGNVVLHDLAGEGGIEPWAFVLELVAIRNSASVVLERCTFIGEEGSSGFGGVPLAVDASEVWVANSHLVAGDTGTSLSPDVLSGTPAIEVSGGGRAHVAGSFVQGGDAGFWGGLSVAGQGGSAISIEFGSANLYGGAGNTLRGGDADPADGPSSQGGNAVFLAFGGSASYAADALLEGGLQPNGTQAPYASVFFESSLVELAHARPALRTSAARVAPGGAFDLDYTGNAHSPVGTLFSLSTGPFLALPGFDGVLAVDASTLFLGGSVVLDAGGVATSSLTVPADPALAGVLVVFQSVELGPVSGFSNPALLVIE